MQKIKNSFGGVIIGLLMVIGGSILLWWNEGNNVKNIESINEVEKAVIEVKSDNVDSKNEGKLILTKGELVTAGDKLNDSVFPVGFKTPKLTRTVEVYEWKEDSNSDSDGNTTYSYNKVWEEVLIDSSNFHQGGHENPTSIPYDSESYVADVVNVGAFLLSNDQKSDLNTKANLVVLEDVELPENVTLSGGYVTTAKDINNPEIGDIRITWQYNDWTKATVLAVQKGDSFEAFVSKGGRKINRIFEGEKTVQEVLETMRNEDKMMKWIFRAVGAALIIFGWMAFINPLTTLTSFVPFLGGLVGGVLNLIAFLVGLVQSLIIIVIAWFRYRPILAIGLLVVIALAVVGIVTLVKKNKKPKTEAATPVEKEA